MLITEPDHVKFSYNIEFWSTTQISDIYRHEINTKNVQKQNSITSFSQFQKFWESFSNFVLKAINWKRDVTELYTILAFAIN